MKSEFTKEFFSGNRQKLVDTTGSSLIVLAANGLLQRSADTTFPFRQDSNFWYLTGIEEADYVLVIAEGEPFLIAPTRAEHRDLWDGPIDKKAISKTSGIEDIMEHHAGWTRLDKLLRKLKKVHTITPAEAYFQRLGFYANPSRGTLLSSLKKHRLLELVDIRKDIARLRQIKQLVELEAICRAIEITSATLKDVRKNLSTYKYEYEVSADITAGFIRRGAQGHAYLPIVAAGRNAATIHYIDNRAALNAEGLLLMDVGAEVSNYSADITRTYALQTPTKRQQSIHAAVLSVQQAAYDYLKPGVTMKEYEKSMDNFMAKELVKLKLLDDPSNHKKLKKYYPHLTSHFLGLDTHDSADYELPLAPGMVLTVEPGIYIPEEGIGVRIEDNVLVTGTGIEILNKDLPTGLN